MSVHRKGALIRKDDTWERWWTYLCPGTNSRDSTQAFVSVTKWCPTCDPMDCSTPGFLVLHYLPEFAQTHLHRVGDAIQPSHPLSAPCLQSFPASVSFQMSQFFASGAQSIGASASTSVRPMNIQGLFPLSLTSLISLLSKRL